MCYKPQWSYKIEINKIVFDLIPEEHLVNHPMIVFINNIFDFIIYSSHNFYSNSTVQTGPLLKKTTKYNFVSFPFL